MSNSLNQQFWGDIWPVFAIKESSFLYGLTLKKLTSAFTKMYWMDKSKVVYYKMFLKAVFINKVNQYLSTLLSIFIKIMHEKAHKLSLGEWTIVFIYSVLGLYIKFPQFHLEVF